MARSTKKARRQVIESSSDNEELLIGDTSALAPDTTWDLDFSGPISKIARPVETQLATENGNPSLLDIVYEPRIIDFEKLVIHKNKLEQAENWFLEFTAKVNKRILVISGPAGCGKTTLFKSLCRKYDTRAIDGYTIEEHHRLSHQGSRYQKKTRYSYPSLSFGGLAEGETANRFSGDLIYFDDLPNLECNGIIENLLQDLDDSTFSLAFLVTDPSGGSSLNDDSLLRRILDHSKTFHISLNPIAPMFQTKMIKQILSYEDLPPKEELSDDLRASLLNIHLHVNFPELPSFSFARDHSVGLFHSLGKILYSRHRKEEFVDAAQVTESNRELFQSFLHANYPKFFVHVADIDRIADSFSYIDSVPWNIYQDFQWHRMHAALPESTISSLASTNGGGSVVKNFYSFVAPVRLPRDKFFRPESAAIEEE